MSQNKTCKNVPISVAMAICQSNDLENAERIFIKYDNGTGLQKFANTLNFWLISDSTGRATCISMARRISVAVTGYTGAYAAIWGILESDVTNAIQNLTNTC